MANKFRASSQAENTALYGLLWTKYLNDTDYGNCGLNVSDFSVPGYDLCTGIGTPKTLHGK